MRNSQLVSYFFFKVVSVFALFLTLSVVPIGASATEGADEAPNTGAAVMEVFNEQAIAKAEAYELSDERKHQILFVMGVLLLVLLGFTAYFGIAMGIGGKDVFVPHMVSAGLTITLSLAHAVTAVVWFFPF